MPFAPIMSGEYDYKNTQNKDIFPNIMCFCPFLKPENYVVYSGSNGQKDVQIFNFLKYPI